MYTFIFLWEGDNPISLYILELNNYVPKNLFKKSFLYVHAT